MEVKQINQLMVAMGRYGVKRLLIKREDVEVEIERECSNSGQQMIDIFKEENPLRGDFEKHKEQGPVRSGLSASDRELDKTLSQEERDDDLSAFVSSPMVGTVYYSPSPTEPLFVKIGDRVEKNTVVCIVEAMKVMNEIKAGVSGTIQEVLVENGSPVEFGSRLIRVAVN